MGLDYEVHVGPYVEVTPAEGAPSWGDVAEKIDDALACHTARDGRQFWTPNADRDEPREMSFDPKEGDVFWPLAGVSASAEIDWLAYSFVPELKELRAAYGAENVRLRWGVLNMIS